MLQNCLFSPQKSLQNHLFAARKAFDAFFAHYPYCYGYWKKYADMERRFDCSRETEEVRWGGPHAGFWGVTPLFCPLWWAEWGSGGSLASFGHLHTISMLLLLAKWDFQPILGHHRLFSPPVSSLLNGILGCFTLFFGTVLGTPTRLGSPVLCGVSR